MIYWYAICEKHKKNNTKEAHTLSKGKREFGFQMPITSLPSEMDIGSIGEPAHRFIDWLEAAGQHYWQILPATHPDGTSPYMSFSAFAGNPILIDLVYLKEEGLIRKLPTLNQYESRIDYDKVEKHHMEALKEAFNNAPDEMKDKMYYFKATHKWVDDYAFLCQSPSRRGTHFYGN